MRIEVVTGLLELQFSMLGWEKGVELFDNGVEVRGIECDEMCIHGRWQCLEQVPKVVGILFRQPRCCVQQEVTAKLVKEGSFKLKGRDVCVCVCVCVCNLACKCKNKMGKK